jgi:hypothetical protein
MTQEEIDKIRAGVQSLDPADDAKWNEDGTIYLKALREIVGFKVAPTTLVAHGLDINREQQRTLRGPSAGEPSEIHDPGEVKQDAVVETQTLPADADMSKMPFAVGDEDGGVSFHRNRKAMEFCLAAGKEMQRILGGCIRKSGDVAAFEKSLAQFVGEIERVIRNRG